MPEERMARACCRRDEALEEVVFLDLTKQLSGQRTKKLG